MGVYHRKPNEYSSSLSPLKIIDQTHSTEAHQASQEGRLFGERCCYKTYARGTEYQPRRVIAASKEKKWAELVPELGNPYDPFAVSVDINHKRIGYVPATQSIALHWRIYALNKRGRSCQVPIDLSEGSALLTMPTFETFDPYVNFNELLPEVERLYMSLPEWIRAEIEEKSGFHISEDWQWAEITSRSKKAPSVAFPETFDASRPHPLFDLFFQRYRPLRREQIKQRKKNETAARREKLESERIAARQRNNAERDDEVLQLLLEGKSKTAIRASLGVSDYRINRVILENAIEAPTSTAPTKTRVQNGEKALALLRQGTPRGRIMMILGIGEHRLKELISLARFLEDPESNRPRLDLAILALQNGWTDSTAPPGKVHKRAIQDAKDISNIETYM